MIHLKKIGKNYKAKAKRKKHQKKKKIMQTKK